VGGARVCVCVYVCEIERERREIEGRQGRVSEGKNETRYVSKKRKRDSSSTFQMFFALLSKGRDFANTPCTKCGAKFKTARQCTSHKCRSQGKLFNPFHAFNLIVVVSLSVTDHDCVHAFSSKTLPC